ncbi:MAG: sigma 54-interacting transcriptional regulator [Ignavibacteria bacterium]|nr:sigma 54-interacting transcriptional regulator [Ignavibacteria bacterium]
MLYIFYRSRLILIIFFLLLQANVFSQTENIRFEHFTVLDGLPHNHIKCITQDHLGFLWFTTQNGLVKYDGYNFKTYLPDPKNANSINTRNPIWVIEDHLGDLWISSREEGLIKFDRKAESFKHYTHDDNDPNSIISNYTYHLYEDKAGTLWISVVRNGLEKFDRDTEAFTNYRNEPDKVNSLSSNTVHIITEDSDGNLWVGTSDGLNKFDRETGKSVRYFNEAGNPNSLIYNSIQEIIEDQSGNLWIATTGGMSKYNHKQDIWKNYVNEPGIPNSLSHNNIVVVFEDKKGRIWAGSRWGGLNLFDPLSDSFIRFRSDPNDPQSISSDYVVSMNEDKTGVLWVGCWLSGLNKIDVFSNKFKHYKNIPGNSNSLSNNWVWCLFSDSEGILWIGTRGGGLNRFDPRNGAFTTYLFDPRDNSSISDNSVGYIFEDSQNYLWIGTDNGLNRFNRATNKFERYYIERENNSNIINGGIMSIVEDSSRNLWIATWSGGLIKLRLNSITGDDFSFARYLHNPNDSTSLSRNRLNNLYLDSFGDLWIGTDLGGLDRLIPESGTFQHFYDRKSGFDIILFMHEDKKGRFWVGTYNGGLSLFDRKTGDREVFTVEDGLPHNSIKGILEDDFGNLWISTDVGISKFNYEKKSFRNFSVSEGLQSGFYNNRAATIGKNGDMYFGGTNGFNRFNPNKLINNPYPPKVVLSDIKLFDTSLPIGSDSPLKTNINITKEIELSYDQNDLTLEYVGLHYSRPEATTYEYKLENYDKNWRNAGTHRFANYTNLEPGEYTFLVKAASSDGVWSENPASLRIIIIPPFWQTAWFKALIALVAISLVFTGYKIRISQLNGKRKLLEEQVVERTEAAKKLQGVLNEVEILKNRLQEENIYLQSELKVEHNFENIISTSEKFNTVLRSVEQVASTDATVLILGETGTGKELLARAIHSISNRSDRPLVKVNCATLPENLIESELFGHEKGAFTGATSRKIGRFELANSGTIFLDEIGELPTGLQTKLLRVLQEGEFERLGDPKTIKVDVRIIVATNRNLEKEISEGSFREDLFYRINVFPIKIPPLRERKEDIPILVKHFLKKYSTKAGKKVEIITQDVMEKLCRYSWPGNIRELENIIERAVITSTGNKLILGEWLAKGEFNKSSSQILPLEEMERRYILEILEMTDWKVSGDNGAAKMMDINAQTLVSKMKKLGIQKPK